ncbi:hypothetical protein GCK32_012390 [Trichostrongylus colubriformis]|uniref:C2H2-type domain-containing protein n=1 Tax=Trichostrongylus colubriformis TaxID=6319 RepID=A0AAN8FJ96_TRICO
MSIKSEEMANMVMKREWSPSCQTDSNDHKVLSSVSTLSCSPMEMESGLNAVMHPSSDITKAFPSDDLKCEEVNVPLPSVLCPACEQKQGSKLYSHLFNMHGYTKAMIEQVKQSAKAQWKESCASLQCKLCGSWHTSKRELKFHKKSFHWEISEANCIQCPICEEEVQSHQHLAGHAEAAHATYPGQYKVESLTFESKEKYEARQIFQNWRKETENSKVLRWAARSVEKRGDRRITYYRCSRALRTPQYAYRMNAKKSTMYCTAFMRVTENNGTFQVLCCSDHAGHEKDPQLLAFDQESENVVVSLLKEGFDINQILEKVKNICGENGQLRKLYHATSWDIRNIAMRNRLQIGKRHESLNSNVMERRADEVGSLQDVIPQLDSVTEDLRSHVLRLKRVPNRDVADLVEFASLNGVAIHFVVVLSKDSLSDRLPWPPPPEVGAHTHRMQKMSYEDARKVYVESMEQPLAATEVNSIL